MIDYTGKEQECQGGAYANRLWWEFDALGFCEPCFSLILMT